MLQSVRKFFTGKSGRRTYNISLLLNIVFLIVGIVVSILLYEGEFSLFERQISQLDSPTRNPIGMWVFKASFIVCGGWFIPNAIYMTRNLRVFSKILGTIAGLFYCLAGAGIVVVACSPVRVSYLFHIIGAGMGFGGLLLAIFISLILLIVKIVRNYKRKDLVQATVFYLPFISSCGLATIFAGIPVILSMQDGMAFGEFVPEGWEIYEWAMFVTAMLAAIGTQRLF